MPMAYWPGTHSTILSTWQHPRATSEALEVLGEAAPAGLGRRLRCLAAVHVCLLSRRTSRNGKRWGRRAMMSSMLSAAGSDTVSLLGSDPTIGLASSAATHLTEAPRPRATETLRQSAASSRRPARQELFCASVAWEGRARRATAGLEAAVFMAAPMLHGWNCGRRSGLPRWTQPQFPTRRGTLRPAV